MLGEQGSLKMKDMLYSMLEDGRFLFLSSLIDKLVTAIDHFSSITEIHVT